MELIPNQEHILEVYNLHSKIMKTTIKIVSVLAIVAIIFTSCKKNFLERPPISNLTSENAIYDEATALSVIRGAYARLRTHKIYGRNYVMIAEVTSDDATNADDGGGDEAFDDFKTNSTFVEFQEFWQGTYEGVQRANNAIDVLKDSKYLSEADRKIVVAEAKFLRAYYNWLLVTVFGEVPLYEKTPKTIDDLFNPQVSVNEMYASIERDLIDASGILPESWPADSKGRATKYAAFSMLGKIYLYQQKWDLAKNTFRKVKDDGKYRLLTNHADNFNILKENGVESIFEIQYQSGLVSEAGGLYSSDGGIQGANNWRTVLMSPQIIGIGFGQIIATRDILNEFEPLDPRIKSTVFLRSLDTIYRDVPAKPTQYKQVIADIIKGKKGTYFNGSYFHIKKGISGTNAWEGSVSGILSDDGTNIPVIRYADVLLMYAEAAAESSDLSLAISLLNEVRERAKRPIFPYNTTYGGHNYPAGTIAADVKFPGTTVNYSSNLDDFRKALVHERRVELAFEYHRFNDLVRWSKIANHPGSATTVFASKGEPFTKSEPEDKKNFLETSKLFPKPLVEVDKSRGTITQNPGY